MTRPVDFHAYDLFPRRLFVVRVGLQGDVHPGRRGSARVPALIPPSGSVQSLEELHLRDAVFSKLFALKCDF